MTIKSCSILLSQGRTAAEIYYCFYPVKKVGMFHLFLLFEEWSNAAPSRFVIGVG